MSMGVGPPSQPGVDSFVGRAALCLQGDRLQRTVLRKDAAGPGWRQEEPAQHRCQPLKQDDRDRLEFAVGHGDVAKTLSVPPERSADERVDECA